MADDLADPFLAIALGILGGVNPSPSRMYVYCMGFNHNTGKKLIPLRQGPLFPPVLEKYIGLDRGPEAFSATAPRRGVQARCSCNCCTGYQAWESRHGTYR